MIWGILRVVLLILITIISVVYIGYYIYILKLIRNKHKQHDDSDFNPQITVIVPTYNDAKTIYEKLLNLIEQSYPKDLMEILLIDSDSRDETVKIARRFELDHPDLEMRIIVENERKGKSEAINKALSAIDFQREIVIMTDANAFLERNALRNIVTRFSSPEIGAVVGRQIIKESDKSNVAASETAYLSFYQKMREGESILDSTIIFDGELSAYRISVIRNKKIREDLNADDSQLAIIVRREGYRSVFEPGAMFYEPLPSNRQSLKNQKVRRGQGLARLLWYNKDIMFNPSFGKFGSIILPVNFFIHIMSPFIVSSIIILVCISAICYFIYSGNWILLITLSALMSMIWIIERTIHKKIKILNFALTFLFYQLILLEGILRHLVGNSLHKWQKVEKKQ